MTDTRSLDALAGRVFDLLIQRRQVLVTAESCTAGLIAATLARVPGMSAGLAGGFVVYQSDSKVAWLDVPAELIQVQGIVSRAVAEAMAVQALAKTPHATIAVSITGHLGPDAPVELDGIAWMGFAARDGRVESLRLELLSEDADDSRALLNDKTRSIRVRHERQGDAVRQVLEFLCRKLDETR